jgi:hypothetical protein
MLRIREWLLLAAIAAGAVYLIFDYWLRPVVEPVPDYVWQLVGWTWFIWSSWYLLQRISR